VPRRTGCRAQGADAAREAAGRGGGSSAVDTWRRAWLGVEVEAARRALGGALLVVLDPCVQTPEA
jgi:hypothetical protein